MAIRIDYLSALERLSAKVAELIQGAGRGTRRQARLGLETLEGRQVPASTFDAATGVLSITGTSGNDDVTVSYRLDAFTRLPRHFVTENGQVTRTIGFPNVVRTIRFSGGDGNDVFRTTGYLYSPTVEADGGDGNDTIHGGSDNDVLYGGQGTDYLYGYGGNDRLYSGTGEGVGERFSTYGGLWTSSNYLYGGEGNDSLYGAQWTDHLYGGRGSDTLKGYDGADRLYAADVAGDLDDTTADPDRTARDGIYVRNTLEGGSGDDELYGSASNDRLVGGYGSDRLFGYGGQDTLYGDGVEVLNRYWGQDSLYGGGGIDRLVGGGGNDSLYAGGSTDPVSALNTPEQHVRGPKLTLTGTSGQVSEYYFRERAVVGDRLYGDAEDESETAYQGDGNDYLYGDDFTDFLFGGSGNDVMEGGAGADLLFGGLGDDVLYAHTAASATDTAAGWATQLNIHPDTGVFVTVSVFHINGNLDVDALFGQGGKDILNARDLYHDHLDGGLDGIADEINGNAEDPDLTSDDDVRRTA